MSKRNTKWNVTTSTKSYLSGDNRDINNQLDEVVIGDWLHLELMDGTKGKEVYWMRLGEQEFWVRSYKGTTIIGDK